MKKTRINTVPIPIPVGIVGFTVNNKALYATASYCGILCLNPPTIYFSFENASETLSHILKNGFFSLNIPSVDLFKKISLHKKNMYSLEGLDDFEHFHDTDSLSPLLKDAPLNLSCKVTQTLAINQTTVIIGEILNTYVRESCLIEGTRNPHLNAIDPVVAFSDTSFWAAGACIAKAFSIGNCYGNGPAGACRHFFKSFAKSSALKILGALTFSKKILSGEKTSGNMNSTIGPRALMYPLPTVLLGAEVENKPNYSTIGNCGILSLNPMTMYVSSVRQHYTNKGIHKNKAFSINIPGPGIIQQTDYCGLVSGARRDKTKIFHSFYGENSSAPMIEECPVNIACTLTNTITINAMEVCIGTVQAVYLDDMCLHKGLPDIKKINPVLYSLDRTYWTIGEPITTPLA